MKNLQILLILLAFPLITGAEENRSIMFGDPEPSWKNEATESATEKNSQHCSALKKEMEALKGRPQRRHAVIERFRLECEQQQTN